MKSFCYKIPQHIEFGKGSLSKLPEMLKACGAESVFLISDRGLESLGVVRKVQEIIDGSGVRQSAFLDVKANPTTSIVNEAAARFKESGASMMVALGGGGPTDVAKAVGVLVRHGGSILDYAGKNKVPGPIVPYIAIPTTAGAGSEATATLVITDEAQNYKFGAFSYELFPKYAILDPELIMTAPPSLAAACGVDAFIHAMEAYLSLNATPFSDEMAEKGMEVIGANLRRFVANRQDEEAACAMMLGSNFAGFAFAWAGLGVVHAMSHPVGGYFNVAHGLANSIILPVVLAYNALADHGRYEKIYQYIRKERGPIQSFRPEMLVEEIKQLNVDLGIPSKLSDVGVTADLIPAMAEDAMKNNNIPINPRQTTKADIIALFNQLM